MIGLSRALRVYAYAGPVDMRKAYEGLSAIVRNEIRRDVLDGELFLFVGKNRRRAKVLVFDGTGLGVYAKRLDKGRFAAPWERARSGAVELTLSELALFLEGSELHGIHAHQNDQRSATARWRRRSPHRATLGCLRAGGRRSPAWRTRAAWTNT